MRLDIKLWVIGGMVDQPNALAAFAGVLAESSAVDDVEYCTRKLKFGDDVKLSIGIDAHDTVN